MVRSGGWTRRECLAGLAAAAAPLQRFAGRDPGSRIGIDHGVWDRFLRKYRSVGADGIARVAYATVAPRDRNDLVGYLSQLPEVDPAQLNAAEQFAYWVNLYNAQVVALVLQYRPKEFRAISTGLFAAGPMQAKSIAVAGEKLSFDDIENHILRPIWQDQRVHYVLCAAAAGGPDLPPEALTGATAERLLDAGARAFVNHPRSAWIRSGKWLYASSLYDWYQADFGGSQAGVISHLRRYANPARQQMLSGFDRITGYDYDWSLNSL